MEYRGGTRVKITHHHLAVDFTHDGNLVTVSVYTEVAAEGKSFEESLRSREFEPDAPNFTPRISGVLNFGGPKRFDYELSILKSVDAEGSACERYHFEYPGTPGLGHLIHTYVCDGKPLPSFEGEPKRVTMENDIDVFAETLWNALDPDNKISLYVLYINVRNGRSQDKLFNKYQ